MGRPSKYSEDLAEKICQQLSSSSKGLQKICESLDISVRSVHEWLNDNEDFAHKYARAREEQADFLADEIIEIADDGSRDTKQVVGKNGKLIDVEDIEWTNRSRLKVDARKWKASKLAPKKYSEKYQVDTTVTSVQLLANNPLNQSSDGKD